MVSSMSRLNYGTLRQRADQLSRTIVDRARLVARQAGLDPNMPFLHAHNAMCGLEFGRPWKGVDYSLCRKVLWLEQRSFRPHRLLDSLYRRIGHESFDWS